MTTLLAQSENSFIPQIPIGKWVATFFEWLDSQLTGLWAFIESIADEAYDSLAELFLLPQTWVLMLIAGAIAWAARGWKFGIVALIGFALIDGLGQWQPAMETLALILIAAIIALIIGIPIGIAAAQSNIVSAVTRPVLDFMQTVHPFVYLPIVIAFFGIGAPAGIVATIVFATPPAVRLTELGIRQVDAEMVEAGEAFGATRRQILGRVQLPLAISSIMAGVNQVIMLSLSMVVLASLVGTPGLGQVIRTALARVDVAQGVSAGLALVIIAIFLDRSTAAIGLRTGTKQPV